jgi:uncharacterized membrane-anchored protein
MTRPQPEQNMTEQHPDHAGLIEHHLRFKLNNEIHARPPVPLEAPELISYMAVTHEESNGREAEIAHLRALAAAYAVPLPEADGDHLLLDVGPFRVKWERHTEFSTYTFIRVPQAGDVADTGAIRAVPSGWLEQIPGRLLVATHLELRSAAEVPPTTVMGRLSPTDARQTVTSQVADGAAWVFTDFLLSDGWSRFLVVDATLTPRQAGRTVQRLVEIETYRMMALLAFPVAKEVGQLLGRAEGELADLMDRMGEAHTPEDEREVLARLTRLAAEVERSVARTTFRFGAAAAYHGLVRHRIAELREIRLQGFPTIEEFMERRLSPAINTCAAIARRQEDLSGRIARNSQLLRTRVDIELQRQNQELLAQMNRRARLQLRLQQTVEGLSVVAITYYASQLVQYLAKGAKHWLEPLTPEGITAVSIPIIAGIVALGLKRMHKALAAEEGGH